MCVRVGREKREEWVFVKEGDKVVCVWEGRERERERERREEVMVYITNNTSDV